MADVFAAHHAAIRAYCYRRTSSWSAAEDLTSTVFLEVWRARERAVLVESSILPWLYGVAANVCHNHVRAERRRQTAMARIHTMEAALVTTHDDPLAQWDDRRRIAWAMERLRQLPQGHRDVFVLVCWHELSYAAAARALAIPVGTVRSRMSRTRRVLRARARGGGSAEDAGSREERAGPPPG